MGIPKRTTTSEFNVTGVGPAWIKQSRTSFTVCSDFKGSDVLELTVIVADESRGNRFWDKHVLRSGEKPEEILYMRDALKSGKADVNYAYLQFGDKINQGISGSTVVSMQMVNERNLKYRFAYALAKALRADKFGANPDTAICAARVDIVIDFKVAQCVKTLKYPIVGTVPDHSAKPVMIDAQAMYVTATQQSLARNNQVTFEIDHCHYACDPDRSAL
jgi:hypothetical protein